MLSSIHWHACHLPSWKQFDDISLVNARPSDGQLLQICIGSHRARCLLLTALLAGQHPQRHQDTVCVVDMGMHLLPKVVGARLVVQLLVPGLEERARAVKPLASLHNTAGAGTSARAFRA